MSGDDRVFLGCKPGGKYRHVKPSGRRVDNFAWWYCPSCYWCEFGVQRAFPRLCARCYNPDGVRMTELSRLEGISDDVVDAAARIGGAEALSALIRAALAQD